MWGREIWKILRLSWKLEKCTRVFPLLHLSSQIPIFLIFYYVFLKKTMTGVVYCSKMETAHQKHSGNKTLHIESQNNRNSKMCCITFGKLNIWPFLFSGEPSVSIPYECVCWHISPTFLKICSENQCWESATLASPHVFTKNIDFSRLLVCLDAPPKLIFSLHPSQQAR